MGVRFVGGEAKMCCWKMRHMKEEGGRGTGSFSVVGVDNYLLEKKKQRSFSHLPVPTKVHH